MELWVGQLLSAVGLFVLSFIFCVILPSYVIQSQKGTLVKKLKDAEKVALLDNQELEESTTNNNLEAVSIVQQSTRKNDIPIQNRNNNNIFQKLTRYNVISGINCFCGGLFLGVCILDMIPSAQQDVHSILNLTMINQKSLTETTYPIAEFMISFGLILVVIVETIMTSCCEVDHHGNHRRRSESASSTRLEISEAHQRTTGVTRIWVLTFSLVFHSVFEGMSIGLSKKLAVVFRLFLVLALHKCPFGFGIGIKIFDSIGVNRPFLAYVLCSTFCLASPIGAFIGAVISAQNSLPMLYLQSFFSCLVAGTFIYITFVEVIPSEFSHSVHHEPASNDKKPVRKLLKLLFLIVGFLIACSLQFL